MNNECMHITNVTNFNDAKLTNSDEKKEHLKKKHNFDLNLNQHSRNRICVCKKRKREKENYIVENYIHNKHLIKRESHRTAASRRRKNE